jgi:uncharacterized protein
MTNVVITKKGNDIVSIVCSGHTGYADEGEDIVCAGLSSIIQTACIGVIKLAKVNAKITKKDNDGFLSIVLPENCSDKQKDDCNLILETAILGINDLQKGYSNFIKVEVRKCL